MKKDPKDCTHPDFQANVKVGRFLDSGKYMAEVTVQCTECGEPFRFIGLQAGIAWDHPTVSIDGLELHAPIEPEGETQLHTRATYQMPKLPTRH